ncbi:MAG: hypothetical protein MUO82_00960 [Candidatus Thermoplasmatota archaeon]|nr:hypothetical protein [Candidatus Thermoplasmatota archaeon]
MDTEITIDNLLSIKDFNETTKDRIKKSDILLVPQLEFKDKKDRVFYPETSNFLKFARKQKELKSVSINICENQGQEKTLDLHYDEIWLPILLVSLEFIKNVGLPIITSLISNYLFYRYTKGFKEDKQKVHIQIIVNDGKSKSSKKLEYNGPISGLDQFKKIDVNKIFDEK